MPKRQDLKALRNLIDQAMLAVAMEELPEGRFQRSRELLRAAAALADALLEVRPAAVLGAKGGKATAKRGPEYFRKITAMRQTKAGGRPRKGRATGISP